MYTVDGLSIGEITRRINAEGIPTRKASARWERSTVWAVLRNSAYRGVPVSAKRVLVHGHVSSVLSVVEVSLRPA